MAALARVFAALLDRAAATPATGLHVATMHNTMMRSLAERFPGAPEHWLRTIAERAPDLANSAGADALATLRGPAPAPLSALAASAVRPKAPAALRPMAPARQPEGQARWPEPHARPAAAPAASWRQDLRGFVPAAQHTWAGRLFQRFRPAPAKAAPAVGDPPRRLRLVPYAPVRAASSLAEAAPVPASRHSQASRLRSWGKTAARSLDAGSALSDNRPVPRDTPCEWPALRDARSAAGPEPVVAPPLAKREPPAWRSVHAGQPGPSAGWSQVAPNRWPALPGSFAETAASPAEPRAMPAAASSREPVRYAVAPNLWPMLPASQCGLDDASLGDGLMDEAAAPVHRLHDLAREQEFGRWSG